MMPIRRNQIHIHFEWKGKYVSVHLFNLDSFQVLLKFFQVQILDVIPIEPRDIHPQLLQGSSQLVGALNKKPNKQ